VVRGLLQRQTKLNNKANLAVMTDDYATEDTDVKDKENAVPQDIR
jgi:hypothetical protein